MQGRTFLRTLALALSLLWPLASLAQVTVSGSGATITVSNDPTTGTILGCLAKIGTMGAIRSSTSDTAIPLYTVVGGSGTSPNVPAVLAVSGVVSLTMDATVSNTRGMFVVQSPTQPCQGHPQATEPSNGMVVGIVTDASTTAGQPALMSAQNIAYKPGSGAGTGSVTSVNLGAPTGFTSSGGPITSAGTLTLGLSTETANFVWAGPPTGAAAAPTFRALVTQDLPAGTASGACTGDLGGTFPACTVKQASGLWALPGDVNATLSGPGTDFTGCDNTSICRLTATGGDQVINSLANGTDGRILNLCNVGTSNTITLVDQSATGTAANKFLGGANLTVRPNACKPIWYDATTARWRPWDSALLEPYGWKSCQIPFGSTASGSAPIPDDDDVLAACANNTLLDWKIVAVKVYANVAGVSFLPKLTGGANITASCSVATAGSWTNCAVTGTPIVHSFTGTDRSVCSVPPCTLDANRDAGVSAGATFGWIDLSGPLQ